MQLEDNDLIIITQSGRYYREVLLKEIRYIYAMACASSLESDIVDNNFKRETTPEASFINTYYFLKEMEKLLRKEFKRLNDQELKELCADLEHDEGFFVSCVRSCFNAVTTILKSLTAIDKTTERSIKEKWSELLKSAESISELKQNLLRS